MSNYQKSLIKNVIFCNNQGVTTRLLYPIALVVGTRRWLYPCPGLMSSIVLAGYGFGSLIWIPLETAWVNPANLAPGEGDYYDDPKLLER